MKKLTFLLTLSLSLFGFEYTTQPTKVADNVWCFLGKLEAPSKENGGAMTNGCYVKTDKSYVVVDSGPSAKYAKHTYKLMSQIEKLPVSTVINTHEHDDHWLGNSYFKEEFNAKLIGTPLQDQKHQVGSKTRMHHLVPKVMEGTKIVKLDELVHKDKTLKVGSTEFQLIKVAHGHTKDDMMVYLPKEKVLFTGDLIMNGRITSNRDGSVIGQLKAVEKIESYDFVALVPGHGFDTSGEALNDTKRYFTLLKTRVLQAIEDEISAEEITKHVTLSEFKNYAMYDIVNKRNVFDAYGELEFYEEE